MSSTGIALVTELFSPKRFEITLMQRRDLVVRNCTDQELDILICLVNCAMKNADFHSVTVQNEHLRSTQSALDASKFLNKGLMDSLLFKPKSPLFRNPCRFRDHRLEAAESSIHHFKHLDKQVVHPQLFPFVSTHKIARPEVTANRTFVKLLFETFARRMCAVGLRNFSG